MKNNQYRCASCQKVCTKIWSDEEAHEEAENIWGKELLKSEVTICDDCFKEYYQEAFKDERN